MAVSLQEMAVSLRITTSVDETVDPAIALVLNRQMGVADAFVAQLIPTAPEAIQDECSVRLVGYLFDAPTSIAGARFAHAWRNSGAASLAARYIERRAGVTADTTNLPNAPDAGASDSRYELQVRSDGTVRWVAASTTASGLPAPPSGGAMVAKYELQIDGDGTASWSEATATGVDIPDIPVGASSQKRYELNIAPDGTASWVEAAAAGSVDLPDAPDAASSDKEYNLAVASDGTQSWTEADTPLALTTVLNAILGGDNVTIDTTTPNQITIAAADPGSNVPDAPAGASEIKRYELKVAVDGTASWVEATAAGTPPAQTFTRRAAITTTSTLTQADVNAGTTSTEEDIVIPTWTSGNRYVWLGVPASAPDITDIRISNISVYIAFQRVPGESFGHKWWRSGAQQNQLASGQTYAIFTS